MRCSKCASMLLLVMLCLPLVHANYPLFDETTKMRVLLVPSDTKVGSAIYRLRATDSDFDYPLAFEALGRVGKNLVRVETLPCARNHTACEANVYLARPLERSRIYHFRLSVRDSRGDSTNVEASLRATNGSSITAIDTAFPHYTTLVMVPENAKPGTELEYIMVRKNFQNSRHAYMELLGSPIFSMKQRLAGPDISNGTIILNDELDFERQNLYSMQLYATDPFVNFNVDTRNILNFDLAIVVTDVQDTPPVFISAPPVTPLSPRVQPGDLILQVKAEDGDRGHPRDIRYGLLSEGNPFTPFFSIDENTGDVRLTRSLNDLRAISRPGQPVMLRVLAEEVSTQESDDSDEFSQSSIAELALLLPGSANTAPYFESQSYVASIAEGSAPGTPLLFTDPWMPRVRDNDMGLGAVFSLSLQDDNSTFEISPTVAEGSANFVVRVKNNAMLDYERFHTLAFKVVAREVSQSGAPALSASASVIVLLTDVNDNAPRFQQNLYTAHLAENITAGTLVAQVHADDVDTGTFGRVRYTRLLGQMNGSLALDPETGQVIVSTNNHGFDREEAQEYRLYVEARDEEGEGQATTVPLVISLIDVNDHAPVFEYDEYELFLGPENKNFTTRVYLKATDADAENPNNEVRYEIMSGNVGDKFQLDDVTGELTVRPVKEKRLYKRDTSKEPSLYALSVRAYDMGVPHRWSRTAVRIHSAGSDGPTKGSVVFIVPRSPASVLADPRRTERLLAQLTGGRVAIREVRPFRPGDPELIAADLAPGAGDADKSVVVALVTYTGEPAIVDVALMQQRLMANHTNTITREVVTEYRAESSAMFWFTLFLALLLAIAIIIIIICFFCTGCPLYIHRKPRSAEEVRLVLERPPRDDEEKIVVRREAWSAEGGRRYFQFNRRNILTLDHRPSLEDSRGGAGGAGGAAGGVAPADAQVMQAATQPHQNNGAPGPSIIYTNDFHRHRKRDVYVEDVESDYPSARKVNFNPRESTRSLPSLLHTPSNMPVSAKDREVQNIIVHQEESADEIDSMRRHEMERGSDLGQVRYIMRERSAQTTQEPDVVEVLTLDEEDAGREQHYLKAGNAEVLRLVTRGKHDEALRQARNRRVNQTDAGKDIIMRRFMEDQRQHNNMSNSSQISIPGQVLLQTGTQTDEERGTQTENESINSPNNHPSSPIHTPPHSIHIIKTPILEETESLIEHTNTSAIKSVRETTTDEILTFSRVVDEVYERGKAETEFNYGDTKSTTLRRKMIYEKAGLEETTPEDTRKHDRDIHVLHDREEKKRNAHRSQSVPRNAGESKKRASDKDALNKPLRHKSNSINSGLDKSSRVTFASPDQSLSDDEMYAVPLRGGVQALRASNTSLNKALSPTPKIKKIASESLSDDENISPNKSKKLNQSQSNFRGSNLSLNSKKHKTNNVEDLSDEDIETVTIKTKKSTNSLHASQSSLKSTSPATQNRKTHDKDVSDEELVHEDSVVKSSSSVRVNKPNIKKISNTTKSRKAKVGSASDEDNDKSNKVAKPRVPSRNSKSISPAPKSRKSRPDDSDEDVNANKSKPSRSVKSVKATDRLLKKSGTSSTLSKSKNKADHGSDDDVAKIHQSKSRSSSFKADKNNIQNSSKSNRLKQNKADTETSDKNLTTLKKNSVLSSKTSANKQTSSPSKNSHSGTKDDENYSDEESDTENLKSILDSSSLKSKFSKPDTQPIRMEEESDEVYESKNYDESVGSSLQSVRQQPTGTQVVDKIENEFKNNITFLEESINNKLNERLNAIESKLDTAIDSRSNNNANQMTQNDSNLSKLTYGIMPLIETGDIHPNDNRLTGDILQQETAMQTDVTLLPLINSIGLGRMGRDDDLDSGIAMSLTASDVRSRRLNQLIEKKSIFTIAYDDMHTKQLRADSASPQY